ncbi:hypothetical protein AgCh_037819 [Apium graveolens]
MAGGSVADSMFLVQIQPNHPLDEMSMACILRDLLHAVEYLHNEGKFHRDIKVGSGTSNWLGENSKICWLGGSSTGTVCCKTTSSLRQESRGFSQSSPAKESRGFSQSSPAKESSGLGPDQRSYTIMVQGFLRMES